MRKIVKEKAVRFVLNLKCVKCGREKNYYLGYDYKSNKEAKEHIATHSWNGWLLDNTEVCPICRFGKGETG